jgi:hypothetical protein
MKNRRKQMRSGPRSRVYKKKTKRRRKGGNKLEGKDVSLHERPGVWIFFRAWEHHLYRGQVSRC